MNEHMKSDMIMAGRWADGCICEQCELSVMVWRCGSLFDIGKAH